MKSLILTLAVCCVASAAQAKDTLRYALLTYASAIEESQTSLLKNSAAGEVKYIINSDEVTIDLKSSSQDESLINWMPMSIEAFGYDIRETWQPKSWGIFSYSLAFSR